MYLPFIKKTLLAIAAITAALTMSTGFAFAKDDDRSFEDGLKNNWSESRSHNGSHNESHSGSHNAWHNASHSAWQRPDKSEHAVGHANRHEHEWEFHVSPVPEPGTDTMLLAGLVVLWVAVRRKTASAAQKALPA
jgi:hypothetical protein